MNLQQRIEILNKITSYFPCYRPHPLICVLRTRLPFNLEQHALYYLRRSLEFDDIQVNNLFHALTEIKNAKWRQQELKVITPNGMVVPKNESILEFNLLAKSFYDLIGSLKIDSLIHSWNVPPNLRVKTGIYDPDHLKRKNASEHIHSDAWAGEQPNCGTAMLFLGGDVSTNGVEFYVPPDDFQESWLETTDAGYLDKQDIINRYSKLRVQLEIGDLVLSDFATLHASMTPVESSKPRVSIDSVFAYCCADNMEVSNWRGLRVAPKEIKNIGRSSFLYTEASVDDWVDSKEGFRQSTDIRIVDLKNTYIGPYND